MSGKAKNIVIILLICVIIAVLPLIIIQNSEFGGADGMASEFIEETNPDYEVWADPILEPPGGETESLLFSLQAAIGAGIFGYGIGVLKERSKHRQSEETQEIETEAK